MKRSYTATIAIFPLAMALAACASPYYPQPPYYQQPTYNQQPAYYQQPASYPPPGYHQQPAYYHQGPQASNSENCGTPNEPRQCPPMPRVPLQYYPANKE